MKFINFSLILFFLAACNADYTDESANEIAPANTQTASNFFSSLVRRKTINIFTWNILRPNYKVSDYGLVWGFPPGIAKKTTLSLTAVSWELQRIGSHYADFKGNENYLLDYSFLNQKIGNNSEYGSDFATNHQAVGFPQWLAETSARLVDEHNSDGILLDWWHNNHPTRFSPVQIRSSRIEIAQALRTTLGNDAIIMANVNQTLDQDTVQYLNGVFMESWKENPKENYTLSELKEIERAMRYYEINLRYPKIIALEGWRVFSALSDADMNSLENRRSAKLFTALSVVIPTTGYVLFADNNADNPQNDHDHIFYDFYQFDAGKPIRNEIRIKDGSSYKEHERGFIGYNITGRTVSFTRENGETFSIEPRSGLFCEDRLSETTCLNSN